MFCVKDVAGERYLETFQPGRRYTPISATGAKMGRGCRSMTVYESGRRAGASSESIQAVIDSQSVKSAAMVEDGVGYDAGKQIKGRKRFLSVDTLGLVLRVLVTAASGRT